MDTGLRSPFLGPIRPAFWCCPLSHTSFTSTVLFRDAYGSIYRHGLPLISAWIIKYIHIIGPFVRDSINDSPHKGPVMSKPPGWASVLVTGLSMSVRVCFWLQKYLFAFARSVQKLLSVLGYTQSLWIISIMPKFKNINSFFSLWKEWHATYSFRGTLRMFVIVADGSYRCLKMLPDMLRVSRCLSPRGRMQYWISP